MTLYTIGHSNISLEDFFNLLKNGGIEVLVDVRSAPYSKYASQFNKENLAKKLQTTKVNYIYMGDLIGGMPKDENYYINGKIDYDLVKKGDPFRRGIDRLLKGIKQYRVAIMCAEEDPSKCHRRNLIARELHKIGVEILHIRGSGLIEKDYFLDDKIQSPQGRLF